MLKTVEEIKDLRSETQDQVGNTEETLNKWVATHANVDPEALRQYIESEFPTDPKSSAYIAFQLGVAARERAEKS